MWSLKHDLARYPVGWKEQQCTSESCSGPTRRRFLLIRYDIACQVGHTIVTAAWLEKCLVQHEYHPGRHLTYG